MKKYLLAFKISLARKLTYRTNFLFGRVSSVIILLLMYYLWFTVTDRGSHFSGYTREQLMAYVFGIHILTAVVFGSQTREVAREIHEGDLSRDLIRPIKHWLFFYSRELAERMLFFVSSVIEVIVVAIILDVQFFFQKNILTLFFFFLSVFLAHILYFILSYLVSMVAFWSREAMGPRFLFEWILEFASGRYFPLSIVAAGWLLLFKSLPFIYLLFMPMELYLGRLNLMASLQTLGMQLLWIIIIGLISMRMWNRGLRRYTGAGI